jgi:hypothetical protein
MTLINMSPTDFLRSGATLILSRRDELEVQLSVTEKLIERAENGEFPPEFLKRQQDRRDEIVKELAELEDGKEK